MFGGDKSDTVEISIYSQLCLKFEHCGENVMLVPVKRSPELSLNKVKWGFILRVLLAAWAS
jgi:hypothetical protein